MKWKDLGGKDEKILALTKVETDTVKATIRKTVPCFKDLKEAASIAVVPASPETAEMLKFSRSIGFTDMIYVQASQGKIAALSFDGVQPTIENIMKNRYKLVQTFGLVTKQNAAGPVKDFIKFIRGPKGSALIKSHFAIPAS